MNVPTWVWLLTIGATTAFLLVDVFVIGRRPHVPSMGEAARHLTLYVALAVLFGLGVWYFAGPDYSAQFFAGWLTEYSLLVDNLFVFLIIMAKFAVPHRLQQTALMVGIVIALVLRGVFIAVGAAAINAFSWIFFVFGAFLVYTAVRLFRDYRRHDESEDLPDNGLMRFVKHRFNATDEFRGTRLTVSEHGKRLITPMLIVIVALGSTDLLFALDSIPAIYGLTHEPYLVLTANLFALMGLRQLYFLIGGLLRRLVYLNIGLAVLLAFIGVKLGLHAMHENTVPFINGGQPVQWAPDIPISLSLAVIVGVLVLTTVASLVRSGREARAEPAAPPAATGEKAEQGTDDA